MINHVYLFLIIYSIFSESCQIMKVKSFLNHVSCLYFQFICSLSLFLKFKSDPVNKSRSKQLHPLLSKKLWCSGSDCTASFFPPFL